MSSRAALARLVVCLHFSPLFILALTLRPADASTEDCSGKADWKDAAVECTISTDEARDKINTGTDGPAPTHKYKVVGQCNPVTIQDDNTCTLLPCPDGGPGDLYALHESPAAANPPQWTVVGNVCLENPDELLGLSAETVAKEFTRLTWPQANLAIQPPDGETLVNLPTTFRATNPDPITQTVTLLGHTVNIEATPTQWTWHWAQHNDHATTDDKTPHTTNNPGAPHPHATITHAYRLADTTVTPSVDVTYQGRYRVDGGTWENIPDTHTINGTPGQTLTVLEARPTLMH